jgi:hypothetical protein
MRSCPLLLVAALALTACDLFQKPASEGDVAGGDATADCQVQGALIPFAVDVTRDGEADATLDLFASGQAQVTYLGQPTGSRADGGYAQELRLRFYDDAREVVLAVALPPQAPPLAGTVGETLEGVVVRRAGVGGVDAYVALRDLLGNLRTWLVMGAWGGPSDEAGWACPLGFFCPTAMFAETTCTPVTDTCGARLWPPLELRPAGQGDPVTLAQGEVLPVSAGGATWTLLVSYAARYEGELTCTDRAAAALAVAVLPGAPPE